MEREKNLGEDDVDVEKARVRGIFERRRTELEKTGICKGGRTRKTQNSSKAKTNEMEAERIKGHLDKKIRMTNLPEETKNAAALAVKVTT